MNDVDLLIARTQMRLAFLLSFALILLVFFALAILFMPGQPNDKLLTLGVTLGTGLLGLAGQSVAFFFARHRPPTQADNDLDAPAPPDPLPRPPLEKAK